MSVYCAADFHGCYWAWKKIKEILKPDDKLFFLGDAADRGPYGWKIIKELLKDKRVTYIKGNHENFLVNVFDNATPDYFDADFLFYGVKLELWFLNGGEITFNSILNDKSISRDEIIDIVHQLKNLPFCVFYHNQLGEDILLSHAGVDNFEEANTTSEEYFLWDRSHCMFYDTWYGKENEIIVHGHTPVDYLFDEHKRNMRIYYDVIEPEYNGGSYWYAKGHKIDIDIGTVYSNEAILLNLDTWEEIMIKNEE